jgi:hypothetical protein
MILNLYLSQRIFQVSGFMIYAHAAFSQCEDYHTAKATNNFNDMLRVWDGFGINYVQTAQTLDYSKFQQEYGGFSLLDEKEKPEIIDNPLDVNFIWQILTNIYLAKINGHIPWTCIQPLQHWVNKDPNPRAAIFVNKDGPGNFADTQRIPDIRSSATFRNHFHRYK